MSEYVESLDDKLISACVRHEMIEIIKLVDKEPTSMLMKNYHLEVYFMLSV